MALRFLYARADTGKALQSFVHFHHRQRGYLPRVIFTSTPDLFSCSRTSATRIHRAPPMRLCVLQHRLRTMHAEMALPLEDWPYLCKYLIFLHNFTPHHNTTPIDLWTGKVNTLPVLHPFACVRTFSHSITHPSLWHTSRVYDNWQIPCMR